MATAATPGRAPTDEPSLGTVLDHYRIGELVGRGAFASIWAAVDQRDGRAVVLKIPDEARLTETRVARSWRREVDLARLVDHPNVQRSPDRGERRSRPYLVVDRVEGRTLRALLTEQGPLPPQRAVGLARQLLEALAHLEGRGILHRDVKPENLLVDGADHMVLVDLGLAVRTGRRGRRMMTFDIAGTPDYMAPERVTGNSGDERSELYSAGAVLYEMLTGEAPLHGDTTEDTFRRILDTTPVPPRDRDPSIPAGLDLVVRRLLRKDPEERYQYAEAAIADLDRLDRLDPAAFPLGPDRTGGAPATSEWRLVLAHVYVGAGFLAVSAAIVGLVILLGSR